MVRDFAARGGRPARAANGTRSTASRPSWSRRWATSGCSASSSPRSSAARARDFTSLCVAIEELGRVDQSDRHHPLGGRRPGHQPDPHLRHRRAEAALAARPRRRPRAGRLRPDRARGGFGRRRDPDASPAGRRQLGDQRREGVHHELRHADHQRRHGDRPDRRAARRPPEISPSWCPPARPGFTVEPAYDKLGWHISDTHGLVLRRLPGARGPTCSASAARGFTQFLAILDDGRIAISAPRRRARPGLPRRVPRATPRHAADLRPADRRQPGGRLPDQRPRGRGRGRPAAHLQGGLAGDEDAGGAARPRSSRPRRSPSCTPRRRRRRHPTRDPGLRRRRLHGGVSIHASPASTGTPRSSRSARAPPRCSAWSSPAGSACRSREPDPVPSRC